MPSNATGCSITRPRGSITHTFVMSYLFPDSRKRPKRPDLQLYQPRRVQAERSPQEEAKRDPQRSSASPEGERSVWADTGAKGLTVTVKAEGGRGEPGRGRGQREMPGNAQGGDAKNEGTVREDTRGNREDEGRNQGGRRGGTPYDQGGRRYQGKGRGGRREDQRDYQEDQRDGGRKEGTPQDQRGKTYQGGRRDRGRNQRENYEYQGQEKEEKGRREDREGTPQDQRGKRYQGGRRGSRGKNQRGGGGGGGERREDPDDQRGPGDDRMNRRDDHGRKDYRDGRGKGRRGRGRGRGSRESTPRDDELPVNPSMDKGRTQGGRGKDIAIHDASFEMEWDYQIEEGLLDNPLPLNTESVTTPVLETAELEMSFSDDDLDFEGGRKPRTESLNWGDIVDAEEAEEEQRLQAGEVDTDDDVNDGDYENHESLSQPQEQAPKETRKRVRKRRQKKTAQQSQGDSNKDPQQPSGVKRYSQQKYVTSDESPQKDASKPKITENEQVASEVDQGKFQGLVITNSRFDGERSKKGDDLRSPEQPRPGSAGGKWGNRPMSGNSRGGRSRHSSGESQESWGGNWRGGRGGRSEEWNRRGGGRRNSQDDWGRGGGGGGSRRNSQENLAGTGRRGGGSRRNSQENLAGGGRRGRRNSGHGSDNDSYSGYRKNRSGSAEWDSDYRDDRFAGVPRGGSLKRYGNRHRDLENSPRGPGDTQSLPRKHKNKRRGNRSHHGSMEKLDESGSDKNRRGGGNNYRTRKQSSSSDYHDYEDIPRYKEEYKNKDDQRIDRPRGGGLIHLPPQTLTSDPHRASPGLASPSSTSPSQPHPIMAMINSRGGYMGPRGGGGQIMMRGTGRGRGNRTLYDPNNPNNPARHPPPLLGLPLQPPQGMQFHDPYNQPGSPQHPDPYYVPNYFQGEQARRYFEQISAEYGPGGAFGNMLQQGYGGNGQRNQEGGQDQQYNNK